MDDSFATSLWLTLRAASLCKLAFLPACYRVFETKFSYGKRVQYSQAKSTINEPAAPPTGYPPLTHPQSNPIDHKAHPYPRSPAPQ